MLYRKRNWKYDLPKGKRFNTRVTPEKLLETDYITLGTDGTLLLAAGYAWDGPSGPTIDTPDTLRASAAHDAFFQLMKLGLLDEKWFKEINREFRRMLKEDGVPWLRRWIWYYGVQKYGKQHMNRPEDDETIYIAPTGDIYAQTARTS